MTNIELLKSVVNVQIQRSYHKRHQRWEE